MKKILLISAAVTGMMTAQAQQALEYSNFGSNWSIGLDGGVTTPMIDHAFFGSMRGAVGLHIGKQVSPLFGFGFEASAAVNTSSWGNVHSATAFDNSYAGAYGTVNLSNLFCGYNCNGRFFEVEALIGAGWGHDYYNKASYNEGVDDFNYFATKLGLNFNFNVTKKLTVAFKPSIVYNMTGSNTQPLDVAQTTAAYNIHRATFNAMVGVTYNFGDGFKCVEPKNQAEIDALNAQINELRGALDACGAQVVAAEARAKALAAELDACRKRPAEIIKEVSNKLNSVRYIFFKKASSVITADQQPNVEMIAAYLKNHKNAKVVVKGYASPEGNLDYNIKLATARAQAVKTALEKKYKIAADRITAEGQGIGEMFTEDSWNRVSICTIEEK